MRVEDFPGLMSSSAADLDLGKLWPHIFMYMKTLATTLYVQQDSLKYLSKQCMQGVDMTPNGASQHNIVLCKLPSHEHFEQIKLKCALEPFVSRIAIQTTSVRSIS